MAGAGQKQSPSPQGYGVKSQSLPVPLLRFQLHLVNDPPYAGNAARGSQDVVTLHLVLNGATDRHLASADVDGDFTLRPGSRLLDALVNLLQNSLVRNFIA